MFSSLLCVYFWGYTNYIVFTFGLTQNYFTTNTHKFRHWHIQTISCLLGKKLFSLKFDPSHHFSTFKNGLQRNRISVYQCVSKVKTVFLHFCGFCLWLTNNPSVALTPTVIELSSFFQFSQCAHSDWISWTLIFCAAQNLGWLSEPGCEYLIFAIIVECVKWRRFWFSDKGLLFTV